MVSKLLPLLPPHDVYVEPFGGGASLLFAKPPAPLEVYNDLNSGLVNFYRVLRDPVQFAELHRLATLTPYSREEYEHCRATWTATIDPVEQAYRWYIVARWSFSGRFGAGWGYTVTTRGGKFYPQTWQGALATLPAIHERLQSVQIEHQDWRAILAVYDSPDTLFYCDPPYIPETRLAGEYQHELTPADHGDLVAALLQVQGMVLLSGYAHSIYTPLEQAGWVRKDYPMACSAVGRTRASGLKGDGALAAAHQRIESVWLSPSCAVSYGPLFSQGDMTRARIIADAPLFNQQEGAA